MAAYRGALVEWNDNLNRTLALFQASFGEPLRTRLEVELYDTYAAIGREIEQFLKEPSDGRRARRSMLGFRLTDLQRRVFRFNLCALAALNGQEVGRRRARTDPCEWKEPSMGFGLHSPRVASLQRALRLHGASGLHPDSVFGPETQNALRAFQEAQGLVVDGLAGPATLKALQLRDAD